MDFKISAKINSIITIVKIFIYVFLAFPFFGVLFFLLTVFYAFDGNEVCQDIISDIIKNIPQFIVRLLDNLLNKFDVIGIIILIIAFILFCIAFLLIGLLILKKIKYLQQKGFISADDNELRLFMGVRIVDVKWDNVAEIKIVKQGQLNESKNDNVVDNNSDKDCLGINFVSTDIFPRSFINILNLNKTNYGFHVVYSSNYFAKDINQIYSELINVHKNI